jgi:alanyl-tRNA synthetase
LEIGGVKLVTGEISGDPRQACDITKQSNEATVALFACKTDKGLQFAAACSPGAVKAGANAGLLVRAAAQAAGGSGGGKPDSAMAGGGDASKLGEALAAGKAALEVIVNEK